MYLVYFNRSLFFLYFRKKFKNDKINLNVIMSNWGGSELNVEIYIELGNIEIGEFEN